jgi:hypothetical protein
MKFDGWSASAFADLEARGVALPPGSAPSTRGDGSEPTDFLRGDAGVFGAEIGVGAVGPGDLPGDFARDKDRDDNSLKDMWA